MSEIPPLHGGQLRQIAERFGIPVSRLLDFSANINPEGPPAPALSCLRASLDNPTTLTHYPDLSEMELKRSLASYAGVRPENVVVANGFVPILDAVLRSLPIQKCLVPMPAFVEYRRTLERARVEVFPHGLTPNSDFSYGSDDLLNGPHQAVLLANPQNPSGALTSRDTLLRLAEEAGVRNTYVLLDEAFIDYSPADSLTREINRFPNLIVFRSVTKFFGMPGLRVAYAVANANLSEKLQEAIAPWSITTLASLAAGATVNDKLYASRTIALNNERRKGLQTAIEVLGIRVYPSAANYLLLRLPDSIDGNEFWGRLIREHQLVLRNCANYEMLAARHFRAAVRNDADNERLVEAVTQLLR
jgi:threonine-phosphate decarboxylase